jgi:DNA invertase Pin-like site-specific DNA recombinase
MSEAELHILKARMLEGRKAKARRGELGKAVPMGYLRRPSGEVVLDPDEQAQATIRLVFDLFDRLRTVGKVLRYLVEHDIRLPVRARGGTRKGELDADNSAHLIAVGRDKGVAQGPGPSTRSNPIRGRARLTPG